MEIYLIRHTAPKIEKGICYGQVDVPLADTFLLEVATLKENIDKLGTDITVYSSPLQRCRLLAETLFPNARINYDDRLKELHFGEWELKAWNDIDPVQLNSWMHDFVNVCCPQGESYLDLNRRILDFKKLLATRTNYKKIVIITHAGVIRTFLAQQNTIDLKDSFQYKIAYGAMVKL